MISGNTTMDGPWQQWLPTLTLTLLIGRVDDPSL